MGVVDALFMRVAPQHVDASAGRHQYSRQHLDRGGFAGAIYADITNDLARLQLKVDLIHRSFILKLWTEQSFHRAAQTRFFFRDLKYFSQLFDFNDRHFLRSMHMIGESKTAGLCTSLRLREKRKPNDG